MSDDISEEEIERFVRFPETLPEERRQAVAAALERDLSLKRVAEFYEAFWQEYDALQKELSPSGRDLLDRLFPGDQPAPSE
jgi:hypothetical protein